MLCEEGVCDTLTGQKEWGEPAMRYAHSGRSLRFISKCPGLQCNVPRTLGGSTLGGGLLASTLGGGGSLLRRRHCALKLVEQLRHVDP